MSRYATQSARRFARELARKQGVVLHRFHKLPHTDEGVFGPEWKADAVRGKGFATVWKVLCSEPVSSSELVHRWFGDQLFVIRVRT